MSDFLLQPTNILDSASTRMDELRVSAGKADAYVEAGPGSLGQWDGRMFAVALRDHDNAVSTARRNIQRGEKLLNAVAKNLADAQDRYDTTEQDNTVTVNDIFSQLGSSTSSGASLAQAGSGSEFGSALPGDSIPPAEEFSGIPEWAQMVVELGGSLVSPSYWMGKVLEWTIGVNPIDWFVEQFTGDWKGVTKAGDAFSKVSEYWTAMGSAITNDCGVLFRGWQGDASDSAQSYFRELIEAHNQQASPLSKLGAEYESCGKGMYFAAKGIGALLGTLLDMVAGAAILASAIAVATASGIGAPAAAAMSTALLAWLDAILGVWATVLTIQGVTVGAAYTFVGLVGGYLGTIHPVEQVEMPSEG